MKLFGALWNTLMREGWVGGGTHVWNMFNIRMFDVFSAL